MFSRIRDALERAESFIASFEGDETQEESVDPLLEDIRELLQRSDLPMTTREEIKPTEMPTECPACHDDHISVEAISWVNLSETEVDDWDDDMHTFEGAEAVCRQCQHRWVLAYCGKAPND